MRKYSNAFAQSSPDFDLEIHSVPSERFENCKLCGRAFRLCARLLNEMEGLSLRDAASGELLHFCFECLSKRADEIHGVFGQGAVKNA